MDTTKANPTIALALHYIGAGAVLGVMFYMAVFAKVISPGEFQQVLLAALVALGVYKVSGASTPTPVTTDTTKTNTPST
jgi:hypothetical protein